MQRIKYSIFWVITFCQICLSGRAQVGFCPDNINFENGNFGNWYCSFGKVSTASGQNTLEWTGFSQSAGNHTIIPETNTTLDPFGGFPRHCPNGSKYSVMLGNPSPGANAEGISYIFTIPTGASLFSITFRYAVVLENPNHGHEEQPRFRASVRNKTDDVLLTCMSFDFTANASLPGFKISPIADSVIYKEWTPVTYNLNGLDGKTIQLDFATSDCTRSGHFGYAYVDIDTRCSGPISGAIVCPGETATTLNGPAGYGSYTWYSDMGFSSIISNNQIINLSPVPPAGTIFPLILKPYSGFGCEDTLYATISRPPEPLADAGPDTSACSYGGIQLGSAPDPFLQYQWSPATWLSDADTSRPYVLAGLASQQVFKLEVTDRQTGCRSFDEVTVTPVTINTSMVRTGGVAFCADSIINTRLEVVSSDVSVQWFQNNIEIPGATGNVFDPRPTFTSNYWARLQRQGCYDSTQEVTIKISANPVVGFDMKSTELCTNFPLRFNNTSFVTTPENLGYTWRVNNKIVSGLKHPELFFDQPGPAGVSLLVITSAGCRDSITKSIQVTDKCGIYVPSGFTPNNDGINDIFRPLLSGVKKLHRFAVFDRWGMLVYSTKNIGDGWDGTYKGSPQAATVFIWILEYDTAEQQNILQKGTVMLFR